MISFTHNTSSEVYEEKIVAAFECLKLKASWKPADRSALCFFRHERLLSYSDILPGHLQTYI